MRTLSATLVLAALSLVPTVMHAQGVMIVDATTAEVMRIDSSWIDIDIRDQVAIVRSKQHFINLGPDTVYPKYGYPMSATASAIRLQWLHDGTRSTASMVAQPQDTVLPGTGGQGGQATAVNLSGYLGESPLYFRMLQGIAPGAEITVELSYVELLPYANAHVDLVGGSDYGTLYSGPLAFVSIHASVRSQRSITAIGLSGNGAWAPVGTSSYLSSDSSAVHIAAANVPADHRFTVGYDLDPLGYGVISMSNYLPDSLIKCDELGNGFFVLLIEPEPTSEVISKDFVIVIDKSGSMGGTKIQQAKDAASYMVNNLNLGDLFNVITFNDAATAWSSGLQPANAATLTSALNWIGQVQSGGGTSINTAVTMGINNYSSSPAGHARPMIFLTDGQDSQPNSVILSNASQLRQQVAPDLQIFTFGIGDGFNEQLLNQLAVQNNGISQFLATANFSQVMGDFYNQIQNPVVLAPTATFDRPDVQDLYPLPLMGLFVGQQMALVGRYDVPGPVNLHLAGTAAGQPVAFDYAIELTGSYDEDRSFIPKVWAQKAIDALTNEYYTYATGTPQAQLIADSIASYGICYGITSAFTSFVDHGNGGGGVVGFEEMEKPDAPSHLAYPDPSAVGTTVSFDLTGFRHGAKLVIRITDLSGRLILEQDLSASAGTIWTWDGMDATGRSVVGQLVYQLVSDEGMTAGRLTRF